MPFIIWNIFISNIVRMHKWFLKEWIIQIYPVNEWIKFIFEKKTNCMLRIFVLKYVLELQRTLKDVIMHHLLHCLYIKNWSRKEFCTLCNFFGLGIEKMSFDKNKDKTVTFLFFEWNAFRYWNCNDVIKNQNFDLL